MPELRNNLAVIAGFVVVLINILAVIAGFVVASAVMMCVEAANGRFIYPGFAKQMEAKEKEVIDELQAKNPLFPDLNARELMVRRREAVREVLAGAPAGALLVVVVGWMLGSLAGGLVTTWIGRKGPGRLAYILGGLLTLAGIANNLMLPPPVWFRVLTLIVFLPMTYLGARLAPRPTLAADSTNG